MSAALLAVDVGNTDTSWAIFNSERIIVTSGRMPSQTWASESCVVPADWRNARTAVVSSVLRGVPDGLRTALANCVRRVLVFPDDIPSPLPIDIDRPEQVGADRIAAAAGGLARLRAMGQASAGAVIIDAGTAMTVDALSPSGAYSGGTIAAGIRLSLRALNAHTARLPLVEINDDIRLPGRDTESAMRAGVIIGAAGAADLIGERITEAVGIKGPWFITGGYSALIAKWMRHKTIIVPHLTLEGLAEAGGDRI